MVKIVLRFDRLPGAGESLIPSLKATLLWYAEHRGSAFVRALFHGFRAFFKDHAGHRSSQLTEITAASLMNFRSNLGPMHEWRLGTIAGAIKRWRALGYPGVSHDAVHYLRSARLKGNVKGAAVLTMDPSSGPFTDLELQAIQAALTQAHERKEVSPDAFLAAWLFMLLGARPLQIAALKVSDLAVTTAKDGTSVYTLRVPRAKQRGQTIRAEFKTRPLAPHIGRMLADHAEAVERRFREVLADCSAAPLFPRRSLSPSEPGLEWHPTSRDIAERIKTVFRKARPLSERTGLPLNVNPMRLRRTLGTRAAAEGYGERVIAELLDHSDTQSARVYVATRPEILDRLDKKLALELALWRRPSRARSSSPLRAKSRASPIPASPRRGPLVPAP